jgi:hypothetical protein
MLVKRYLVFSLIVMILGACNYRKNYLDKQIVKHPLPQKQVSKALSKNSIDEQFDVFFKRFQVDSVFQKSRINFPLKNILKADEGDTVKTIDSDKWGFTNFKNIKNLILKENKISKYNVNMILQIEDTGVNVTYSFVYKNSSWRLNSIVDESD